MNSLVLIYMTLYDEYIISIILSCIQKILLSVHKHAKLKTNIQTNKQTDKHYNKLKTINNIQIQILIPQNTG